MLYILGGASRSGKSLIARRLVIEKQIPFFSIDFLVTALEEGLPNLEIKHGQEFISKAEKLWPIIKPLMRHQIENHLNYLIEGDGLLPSHISSLINSYPNNIRVCFVGFSEVALQDKFKQVKNIRIDKNDWTQYFSDEEILKQIKNMIEISKYLKSECKKYNINYFDVSINFKENLKKIFQYFAK